LRALDGGRRPRAIAPNHQAMMLPTSTSASTTHPTEVFGKAKATSDQNRAKLETQTTQLHAQGQADSRVPLGEDHIETSVATEELTAKPVAGGAPPRWRCRQWPGRRHRRKSRSSRRKTAARRSMRRRQG
jgi:hypothetical protein